jgi:hypothetical protein
MGFWLDRADGTPPPFTIRARPLGPASQLQSEKPLSSRAGHIVSVVCSVGFVLGHRFELSDAGGLFRNCETQARWNALGSESHLGRADLDEASG